MRDEVEIVVPSVLAERSKRGKKGRGGHLSRVQLVGARRERSGFPWQQRGASFRVVAQCLAVGRLFSFVIFTRDDKFMLLSFSKYLCTTPNVCSQLSFSLSLSRHIKISSSFWSIVYISVYVCTESVFLVSGKLFAETWQGGILILASRHTYANMSLTGIFAPLRSCLSHFAGEMFLFFSRKCWLVAEGWR